MIKIELGLSSYETPMSDLNFIDDDHTYDIGKPLPNLNNIKTLILKLAKL